MACASQIPAHQIADKGPGTEKMTEAERELLQQPFAIAAMSMGFDRSDLIVYAAKLLQSQNRPLQAPTILIEAEDLLEMEKRGKKFPSLTPRPNEMHEYYYGSDGESDEDSNEESLDYYDANDNDAPASNDLETDCAEPEVAIRAADIAPQSTESSTLNFKDPQVKQAEITSPSRLKAAEPQVTQKEEIPIVTQKEEIPIVTQKEEIPIEPKRKLDNGKNLESLKLKLQVLRSENKRLKERQLCRDCHSRPVSITFLPCGHYSYCYDCGQRFSACPICRKTILADVRTFLA